MNIERIMWKLERLSYGKDDLITRKQLAALMNVCTKTIDRMKASGELIRSMKIRDKELWDRYEFEAWVDAGCPSLSRWDAMQSEGQ